MNIANKIANESYEDLGKIGVGSYGSNPRKVIKRLKKQLNRAARRKEAAQHFKSEVLTWLAGTS